VVAEPVVGWAFAVERRHGVDHPSSWWPDSADWAAPAAEWAAPAAGWAAPAAEAGPWPQPEAEGTFAVSAAHALVPVHGQQVTTKIPPSYDGRTSWFTYEEAIDDWCDLTELEPAKRGPALRSRLEGDAAIYKSLLDRDRLIDPHEGVTYFKSTLRQHFVKGSQSVFLWRFFQILRFTRGQQDMLRWLGRISVLSKRVLDAWGDLCVHVGPDDLAFQRAVAGAMNGRELREADLPEALEGYNLREYRRHMDGFPLNENLFALIVVVLLDLDEGQRERFTSTLSLRGVTVTAYTFEVARATAIELFCAPKSSLENPMYRSAGRGRSFCILDQGELMGQYGYWVEDDETCEVGFLPEMDDVFWSYDEMSAAWVSRSFTGRRMRRGHPKGKGKGKGAKGHRHFVPFRRKGKGKGKGKSKSSYEMEEVDTAAVAKGKRKGKKGKKGKPFGEKPADGGKSEAHVVSPVSAPAEGATPQAQSAAPKIKHGLRRPGKKKKRPGHGPRGPPGLFQTRPRNESQRSCHHGTLEPSPDATLWT